MKYYTPYDIASILRVRPGRVYQFISNNQLGCVQMGANYRISEQDLNKFIKKHYKYLCQYE